MRAPVLSLVLLPLLLAAPARAQSILSAQDHMLESRLRAQQEAANRQTIALQNQLIALEGRLQAERAIADVRAQGVAPSVLPPPISGPPRVIDTGALASIPDDRLAASNARVRAAAENRR